MVFKGAACRARLNHGPYLAEIKKALDYFEGLLSLAACSRRPSLQSWPKIRFS